MFDYERFKCIDHNAITVMKGMNNKILTVDLTGEKFDEVQIEDGLLRDYLGGRGLGVKIFTDIIPAGIDPLGSENIMVITTGLFSGTSIPTNGRFSLVTKSPLTGGIFYSNSGGFFGPNLKRCGIDGLIIKGALSKPGYLFINGNEDATIKDALDLWGLDTEETVNKIKEIEGKSVRTLLIGPAGENLVKISSIMNEAERAFGRGGVGAVMGSKNLKAIVVKAGNKKTEVTDPERLKNLIVTANDKLKVAPITRSSLPKFGTAGLVNIINYLGMFPINNFQKGFDERCENVSGEAIKDQIFVEKEGCYACPIKCGRRTKAGDMEGKGPEYESLWALGPNLGIYDLINVAQSNYLCNRVGVDSISCGATIACAMELQQMGLIKDESIKFENGSIVKDLIFKISKKEGIGEELGEGAARLAKKYNSPESAIHVKGLELPAYDPRGAMGHALGYATSNRGGCHLTGYLAAMEIFAAPKKIDRFTTGGKSDLLALKQNHKAVEDSLVICGFAGWAIDFETYARFATAISGEEFSTARLTEIGERIYTLERMFNIREGFTRKDDSLPTRFLDTPLKEGLSKDHVVPLEKMLDEYYFVRNWNSEGIPKPELVKKLGIQFPIGGQ